MTKQEFAAMLNGREYGYPQFSREELSLAKEHGFIIVTGASDDLMEFEGAMRDEGGCYDGGPVYFDKNGVSQDGTSREYCIHAKWCDKDDVDENGTVISWTYQTDIPHESFLIIEDEEPYCRGIVFSLHDIQ